MTNPIPNPSASLMTIVMDSRAKLQAIKDTLEAEAKYMANPATQAAKAKQIRTVDAAMVGLDTVFDSLSILEDQQYKLEACSICHGVSFTELRMFMSRSMAAIVADAKLAVEQKQYKLPLNLVCEFEPMEPKYATKPTVKWTMIDGKLTPNVKLRSTLPSIKDIIEGV